MLLSINAFLTLLATMLIFLRLDFDRGSGYIVQYRSNLGLNAYKSGEVGEIVSFILFAVLVFAFHTFLSAKTYHVRRYFSVAVLGLGALLLVLAIIVSNALIIL